MIDGYCHTEYLKIFYENGDLIESPPFSLKQKITEATMPQQPTLSQYQGAGWFHWYTAGHYV